MKKFNFSKGLVIGLLTLALCLTCFAAAKVSAEEAAATPAKSTAVEATYDAAADTVKSTANPTAYVYVLKAASGNKLKAGTASNGQLASGSIKISDLGIKGTAKDVYLYVCDKEVEVEETVSANLTIKGNANKVVGVIDYTQADVPTSLNVISAYYVDKATKKNISIDAANTYWSADQDKWAAVNSVAEANGRKDSKNAALKDGFMGKDLAGMLEGGGTIYLKQAGTSGATGTAQFGSKVVKVKIAKQAKAPKAKIDVAKDTIALKNGFDFAIATKANASATEYDQYGTWYTILPVLKTATVSTAGESIIGGTLGTGTDAKVTKYRPLDKKNTDAGKAVQDEGDTTYYYSYTKYAIKALSIDKLFEIVDLNSATDGIQLPDDFRIAIRKSATDKKPASAVAVIELSLKKDKPLVYTQDNVEGQFLVASADEFTKKGITLGDIAGFPGYTGTNRLAIETTGFDKTFKVKTATANTLGRDEGSSFEYAIVATADYAATGDAAIDWTTVKWKKFDPSKLKITEKLSGKYNTVKGTKKTATLKATASADISVPVQGDAENLQRVIDDDYGRKVVNEAVIKTDTKALLLIRRAGDKSSSTRASKPIALYVAKEGKKYNLYSTVSNGETANKYTVVFFKYNAAEGTQGQENYKAAGWYRDKSIEAITGWSQKAQTGVTLPALTNAEYWNISTVAQSGLGTLGTTKYATETQKTNAGPGTDEVAVGQYAIALDTNDDDYTVNIAIREYANATVSAVYGLKTGTGSDATFTAGATPASKVVGKVVNGVVYVEGTGNNAGKLVAPATAPTTKLYVGDTLQVDLALALDPSGKYMIEDASEKAWCKLDGSAEGYTVPTVTGFTDGFKAAVANTAGEDEESNAQPAKVAFLPSKAEDVAVSLNIAVAETIDISINLNGSADTPDPAKYTIKKGGSLTSAQINEIYAYEREGYNPLDAAGSGYVVGQAASDAQHLMISKSGMGSKTFDADVTLYAQWIAESSSEEPGSEEPGSEEPGEG